MLKNNSGDQRWSWLTVNQARKNRERRNYRGVSRHPTPRCLLSLLGNSFAFLHPIFESLEIREDASMNSHSLPVPLRITAIHDMLVMCTKGPVSQHHH